MRTPQVSVVIPAWNCEAVLGAQLDALCVQDFGGSWEVIVADNGSSDGTAGVVSAVAVQEPRVRLVDASLRRGASAARNVGVAAARAEKLLFADADDIAARDWVRLLCEALDEHEAVGGWMEMFLHEPGDLEGQGRSAVAPFGRSEFLISACMAMRRSVWNRIAGFDETWGPGEDIELSMRLHRLGVPFGRVDAAVMHKRVADDPRDVWVQHYRYGLQRARAAATFPEFRDRVDWMLAARKWAWIATHLPRHWRDRDVLGTTATACGRLVGSAKHRTLYF